MDLTYWIVGTVLVASALIPAALILAHMLGWGLELDQQARPPQ